MPKRKITKKELPKILAEPNNPVVVFFNSEQHYNKFVKDLSEFAEFDAEEKRARFIIYQGTWFKCLYPRKEEKEAKIETPFI